MELVAVLVADGVGHHVKVERAPVLVHRQEDLVAGKGFIGKFLAEGQYLFRRDFFILVEGNDIVSAHPAGILLPDFFLLPEGAIDRIPVQCFRCRACHIQISVPHFVAAEDVFDGVPEPAVGLWCAKYCLKHCHGSSISFLQFWMARMQVFRLEVVGSGPTSDRSCWLTGWVSMISFSLFNPFTI